MPGFNGTTSYPLNNGIFEGMNRTWNVRIYHYATQAKLLTNGNFSLFIAFPAFLTRNVYRCPNIISMENLIWRLYGHWVCINLLLKLRFQTSFAPLFVKHPLLLGAWKPMPCSGGSFCEPHEGKLINLER